MANPCIHALFRECPGENCVFVFGDGSIYRYQNGLNSVLAVRGAMLKGVEFNKPNLRRSARFPGPGYARLTSVPSGALELYLEPPYEVVGQAPECPSGLNKCVSQNFVDFIQGLAGCTLGPMSPLGPSWSAGGCGLQSLDLAPVFPDTWRYRWGFILANQTEYRRVSSEPNGTYLLFSSVFGGAPGSVEIRSC
jgi:hypothetical protein